MNYSSNNEELAALVTKLGIVSTPDAATVLTNAAGKTDTNLLSSVKVLTNVSTLTTRLHTDIPEEYEGGKGEPIQMRSSKYEGTLKALLPLGADIYSTVDEDGKPYLGVEGKAKVAIETIDELPPEVKPGQPLIQLALSGAENTKMLRQGLSSTAAKGSDGTQNGILTINALSGVISAFSMDGNQFSWATVQAKIPQVPEGNEKALAMKQAMDDALTKYCDEHEGQAPEAFNVNIPRDEIMRLRQLTSGAKTVIYCIDEAHATVQIDSSTLYTFTLARTSRVNPAVFIPKLTRFEDAAVKVEFDNADLTAAVDGQNNLLSLYGDTKKVPITINVPETEGKGELVVATPHAEYRVPFTETTGEAVANVSVAYTKAALSLVAKGNTVLEIAPGIVFLKNGTLAETDDSAVVGFSQVAPKQVSETSDEEAKDGVETDEASDETPAEE